MTTHTPDTTPHPLPAEVLGASNAALLSASRVLTHRIHESDATPSDGRSADLRAQRDTVDDEILRRMALGWEARA